MSDTAELDALRRITDRLAATPDEQLSAVLDKLLPKVLPLAATPALRESVVSLVAQVMRRAKPLRTVLPCAALLSQLVRTEENPFVCNFAIAFVDVGLCLEATNRKAACADALIAAILSFSGDPFCPQMSSLCGYSALLLEYLPDAYLRAGAPRAVAAVLEDWMLDIALAQPDMRAGASGSVLPGLSDARVSRLLSKRPDGWTPAELNTLKLRVLMCIGQTEDENEGTVAGDSFTAQKRKENRLISIAHSVLISAVLIQQDGDTNLTAQATYKLNSCRTALRDARSHANDSDGGAASARSAQESLRTLLALASTPYGPAVVSGGAAMERNRRTTMRADVRAAILRWVAKEAQEYLTENALECIRCVHSNFFSLLVDQSKLSQKLRAGSMLMLEKLVAIFPTSAMEALDAVPFTPTEADLSYASVLFEVSLAALGHSTPISTGGGGNGGLAIEPSDLVEIRRLTYNVLDRICRVFSSHAVRESNVLQALFRLLPVEDDGIVPALFCALGSLKTAYEENEHTVARSQENSGGESSLEALLRRARASPSPKPRLVALIWCRSLYKWNDFVIETMFILLSDTSELVSSAVLDEFKKLKYFLLHCSSSETTVCLKLLSTLVASLPRLLVTEKKGQSKSSLSLLHCFGCVTVGLKGLVRAAGVAYGPSGGADDWEGDGTLSGIINEHALSFWAPTQWATVPAIFSTAENGRVDIQGVRAVVRAFVEAVLMSASVRNDLFLLLNSSDCMSYSGASCDTNGRVESSLGDLVLHLLYQTLLLRGADSAEVCVTLQTMAPELLSMLARDGGVALGTSVSLECISRSLALMSLLSPGFSRAGEEGVSVHAVIDVEFVQSLTRSLHHKAASVVVVGTSRGESLSTVIGVVRCVEAMMEVVLGNPVCAQSEKFCVQFCFDVFLNSLDCLEQFAHNVSSEDCVTKPHHKYLKPEFFSPTEDGAGENPPDLTGPAVAVLRLLSTAVMDGALSKKVGADCLKTQLSTRLLETGAVERTLAVLLYLVECLKGTCDALKRKLGSDPLKSQPVLLAASLNALGRMFLNGGRQSLWQSEKKPEVWKALLTETSLDISRGIARFSMAECLSRLLLAGGAETLSLLEEFLIFSEQLVFFKEDGSEAVVKCRNAKGTIATTILILLKQTFVRYREDKTSCVVSFLHLDRMCVILLRLLGTLEKITSDSDPLIQDACCAGLCFCYQLAHALDSNATHEKAGTHGTKYHEAIANIVIYTLTRDKKLPQSAGIAPAGERPAAGEQSSAAAATPAQRAHDEDADPLAAAAAEAAARIGLSAADLNALRNAERDATLEQAMGGLRADRVAATEGDYGVYTKACKVAKKSGDPSVVFSVLALIRRNPSVLGDSVLYNTYWPQVAQVDPAKRGVLLPMLYVSKYDPSAPVKAVMKSLWDKLIPAEDASSLLSSYTSEIIRYSLLQTSSRAWRDRECGCLALEAFISQRSWDEIFPFLEELWHAGMQVLDDIRESTRTAAVGFTKVLAQQIMRACTPDGSPDLGRLVSAVALADNTSSGGSPSTRDRKRKREGLQSTSIEATTAVLIPILLDRGLVAGSQEGRGFSLGLLVQVVKVSRDSLQAHLVRIIDILIESMAALEPRTLQYMQFHTARLNISDKELEDLRLTLSQQSPMQEALDICLQSLPPSYLPSVLYHLCGQLRGGVGLATRVSAVKSLLRLMESFELEFKRLDGSLARTVFEACLSVLMQFDITSSGLKSAMLSCLSAASLCVPGEYLSSQCLSLVNRYSSQFSSNFEASETLVIAECLGHILRRAGEQLEHDADAWGPILSCSYIGSFHPEDDVARAWAVTWNEALNYSGCGNKYSALVKTLTLVINRLCDLLRSLSWKQRSVGLSVCRDVSSVLPFDIIQPYLFEILVALFSCIKFRIWNGQAIVLETVVFVLEKYRAVYVYDRWTGDAPVDPPEADASGADTSVELAECVAHQYVVVDNIFRRSQIAPNSALTVNCHAVIDCIMVELERGDKSYRYSASKALSEMHESWKHISLHFPIEALRYVERLSNLAGITQSEPLLAPVAADIASNENSDAIKRGVASKVVTPASTSMFGDRYAKHLPGKSATKSTPGGGRAVARAARQSERPLPTSQGEVARAPSCEISDPAYRVKVMECIYFGWPIDQVSAGRKEQNVWADLQSSRDRVLQWVYNSSKNDTWSIKRQGLLILSSIISRWSDIRQETMSTVVAFICYSYKSNSMHNQVRETALFCLRRILVDSENDEVLNALRGPLSQDIRVLLLQAQNDSAPAVLDELHRIRSKWKDNFIPREA